MRKAIFLDRDGIINKPIIRDGKPYSPMSLDELELCDDIEYNLKYLHEMGYLLIVVTNQPEVARGNLSRETVDEFHAWIKERLPMLDGFVACYHDDQDDCECRKPKPGMLVNSSISRCIDLKESWMIGDRWKDVLCGINAGCNSIFVDCRYNETWGFLDDDSFYVALSMSEACQYIDWVDYMKAGCPDTDPMEF